MLEREFWLGVWTSFICTFLRNGIYVTPNDLSYQEKKASRDLPPRLCPINSKCKIFSLMTTENCTVITVAQEKKLLCSLKLSNSSNLFLISQKFFGFMQETQNTPRQSNFIFQLTEFFFFCGCKSHFYYSKEQCVLCFFFPFQLIGNTADVIGQLM